MIVKMKKVLILTLLKYKRESIEILRELGVVHINFCNRVLESLERVVEERGVLIQALSLLGDDSEVKILSSSNENFLAVAKSIVNLGSEIKDLRDMQQSLFHKRDIISCWGSFSLDLINKLRDSNVYVQFFKSEISEYKKLLALPEIRVALVNNFKGTAYFIAINDSKQTIDSAEEYDFEFDLEFIENKLKVISEILDQKLTQLSILNKYRDILKDKIKEYDQVIEFEQVMADMDVECDNFVYITGFVPEDNQQNLKSATLNGNFVVQFAEPDDNDFVPTYIKRGGIAKLAKPIFDVLDTIPGYRERDVSYIFMLFFFVFFGMIVGDAAYGVIFLIVGIFLSLVNLMRGKPLTSIHALIFYLSTSAVIYGSMTGTWFGSDSFLLDFFPILRSFRLEYLTGKNSMQNIMFICFTIGVLQISLAHIWNFIQRVKEKPHIHSIAQIGWLIVIPGLYYLVLNLILGRSKFPMHSVILNMIYVGVVLVFVFARQDGSNFFVCILKSFGGIIEQFLATVSGFADIISYIRLFAVGLAGLAISDSFNSMSASLLKSSNIGLIISGIIVMLFGHILNITLSLLSVVVHGVRLNMLEFSNHLGQEWNGYSYRPFRKIKD
ncbi:V-type ATP synthase subunit I [Borrelia anserina]|uniref:V-type ATP synthase subunit I n=2 Tax=Borrelia anserina TaxID=143 RepID=W5SN51_BORAN|nr:V-type ATP synthase subunit I [Borrelia anserina]AHH08053.1 V-type ATP synthase subunit I [Borrelia anserina BA2]APR64600.1 ATP synthase subunit I [Borrelia anserina Es]UPA06513.1 V-type ATP synthase subunit I [Borrelia anserina]